jgi:DDE superfamily endonuclease
MSTSNNQRVIRQLRCRDLDPRTKAEFCGLVVQALVESGTLKVSKRMAGRRGSPNWARGQFDMDSHLIALQPGYFKRLYRLSKETFLELVTLIDPRLVRKKSLGPGKAGSMDPRVMLAITLRFLAGATCLDLAWPYCIALPTVYSVIVETLEVLDDSLENIKFPYTEDECRAASEGFLRLRNSPFYGVIGAIDGIAVAIRAPSPSECPNLRSFFNRKGFFAINAQAVVGADYSVLYLSAKQAGSTHDSTAFQSTALFNFLSLTAGEIGALPAFAVLSADDAYGNGSCGCRIITPYSREVDSDE